jgi:hypothetical protein
MAVIYTWVFVVQKNNRFYIINKHIYRFMLFISSQCSTLDLIKYYDNYYLFDIRITNLFL